MSEKFCNGCKKVLPIDMFYLRMMRGKRILRTRCKACFTTSIRVIQVRKQQEIRGLFGNKCERCGYDKCAAALEFHHLRDKEQDLSRMIRSGAISKILKEVEKCILICANCHRELHAGVSKRSTELDLGKS
jgi:hypothetical protein